MLQNLDPRSLASVLLALAALGFAASGLGLLVRQDWWRPATIGAAVFSAAIFILFWDGKFQALDDKGGVGVLTNTADIGLDQPDSNPSDNHYSYPLTSQSPTRDSSVSKYLYRGYASPGGDLTYQVYYQNQGNSPIDNVVVTNTLPALLTNLVLRARHSNCARQPIDLEPGNSVDTATLTPAANCTLQGTFQRRPPWASC